MEERWHCWGTPLHADFNLQQCNAVLTLMRNRLTFMQLTGCMKATNFQHPCFIFSCAGCISFLHSASFCTQASLVSPLKEKWKPAMVYSAYTHLHPGWEKCFVTFWFLHAALPREQTVFYAMIWISQNSLIMSISLGGTLWVFWIWNPEAKARFWLKAEGTPYGDFKTKLVAVVIFYECKV